MRRTFTWIAAAAALFIAGDALAQGKKVRIATEGAYAPWNFTNPAGKLEGFCRHMNFVPVLAFGVASFLAMLTTFLVLGVTATLLVAGDVEGDEQAGRQDGLFHGVLSS